MIKETFNKGIEELLLAFPKMEMTKERAGVWYKYSKNLTDIEWEIRINSCIKNCFKAEPVLADILDTKGIYQQEGAQYKKYEG